MRVVATVVTYNRKDLLKQCIECLLHQKCEPFDILIVDNGSADGTKDMLQSYLSDSRISYYNTGSNLGGAGGFHAALKEAVKRGYEYAWMMDDDTMPSETALQEFLKAADSLPDHYGFLSGKALWVDGSVCKMNEQKLLDKKTVDQNRVRRCRQATFVSLFVPMGVVRQIGLPIKEFFIWGDDVEYTRRISAKYPSYYVPESVVVHKTANNQGSNIAKDDSGRIERYRYAYRNEVYIAKHEGISRMIYQVSKVGYHLVRVLLTSKKQKAKKIGIILSASIEGLRFNPAIEYVK